MAVSSSMPPSLRFVQGFLPVFLFALLYWSTDARTLPLWLLGLIFVLLVLGTVLIVRVLWAVMQRADTIDDGDD